MIARDLGHVVARFSGPVDPRATAQAVVRPLRGLEL